MNFHCHSAFNKELKNIQKKYPKAELNTTKNLFNKYFGEKQTSIIDPGKIHCIKKYNQPFAELWKYEMMIRGLRPSQWPRVWFLVKEKEIYLLHLDTHQNNSDNKHSQRTSKERASEYLH